MKIVLEMHFLTLDNIDIQFDTKCFTWKIAKALFTIKQMKLINKQKFSLAALHKNLKMFYRHVWAINALKSAI